MAWLVSCKLEQIEEGVGGWLSPFLGCVGCAHPGARIRIGAVREAGFGQAGNEQGSCRSYGPHVGDQEG